MKWFLKDALESNIASANHILEGLLRNRLELYVPPIFQFEICNALTKACGHRYKGTTIPRLTKEKAADYMRELFAMPITVRSLTQNEMIDVIGWAVEYGKGYYDMTYLALAEDLDCQWCTADDKFLKAVPLTFPAIRVLPLSSLRLG